MSKSAKLLSLITALLLLLGSLFWFVVRSGIPISFQGPEQDSAHRSEIATTDQLEPESLAHQQLVPVQTDLLNSNQATLLRSTAEPVDANRKVEDLSEPISMVKTIQAGTNTPSLIELVWIPPGRFTMGSPEAEAGRQKNEGPQTVVTISYGFWLGKFEVTQAQWRSVMGEVEAGTRIDSDLPARGMPWHLAVTFCNVLAQIESKAGRLPDRYTYRLPTEAEWEYACRAGTITQFSYGDDPDYISLNAYANFGKTNTTTKVGSDRFHFSTNDTIIPGIIGRRLPNLWGLYDMHGNVSEWCLDWLTAYPGGSVNDLLGAIDGPRHVLRGGAWMLPGNYCRCASRFSMPDLRRILNESESGDVLNAGFRVALAVDLH